MKREDKKVLAYYSSYCFPADWCEETRNHCEVKIEYDDGTLELLHRDFIHTRMGRNDDIFLARIILKHFLKRNADDWIVEKLVDWPGHSLCRLTIKDLEVFMNTCCEQLILL